AVDNGVVEIENNEIHQLTYRVRDVKGNTSTLEFSVQYNPTYHSERTRLSGTALFKYDKENHYAAEHMEITIPENALYDNLHFNYAQGTKPTKGYSLMQHVHNRMI